MNGTPRLRSAFPVTPQTDRVRRRTQFGSPSASSRNAVPKLPSVSALKKGLAEPEPAPVISTEVVSPATQRFAVVCVYLALWIWRLWDLWLLVQDDTESLWQFLKWLFIDSAFLFGVPAMRIPWLEWSSGLVTLLFFVHAIINAFLMFRIAGPFTLFFELLVKFFWDSEIALGEGQVKAAKFTDNADLLSGRHIIHILPEGSAIINPDRQAFCIGGKTHHVDIPIRINQTQPILMELLRIDLDTGANETLTIKKSEARTLISNARKANKKHDPSEPLTLHYPVKKTGRYTIRKVIDESQLAVRPRPAELIVVSCPQAKLEPVSANKCQGDLSEIAFLVEGAPPLKLKYHKTINGERPVDSSFQSVQPEGFTGPSLRSDDMPGTITRLGDVSWARSQQIKVPVSEVLLHSGKWEYAIDEVQDTFGNIVNYADRFDEDGNPKSKKSDVQRVFTVHNRPVISLLSHAEDPMGGCDLQNALKIPEGQQGVLPVKFGVLSKGEPLKVPHRVKVKFTPEEAVQNNGEHDESKMTILDFTYKTPDMTQQIHESGLYTLDSVSTEYCTGEVVEPSSCFVEHPQRPKLDVSSEHITDRCARMPIGLVLDMEFSGVPPFTLTYTVEKKGSSIQSEKVKSDSRRHRLELKPDSAGHYTYRFVSLQDRYYPLESLDQVFEQDVKPSASARFDTGGSGHRLCKGAQAEFPVRLAGEPPFTLVYELVHGGKRKRETKSNIGESSYTILTDELPGGEYELALVSVSDSRDCPETLNEVRKFTVRHQQPKATFGAVDGKRAIQRVEGTSVELPLRLTGDAPWTVTINNVDDSSPPQTKTFHSPNAKFVVTKQGRYEIESVRDEICPGELDPLAKAFTVSWIKRPQLIVSDSPKTKRLSGGGYQRDPVCEGDYDYIELAFSGTAPFQVKYYEHAAPEQGSKYVKDTTIPAPLGLATIPLDTSKAGRFEYKFQELADANYRHSPKHFHPVSLQQQVYQRPSAHFKSPGRTYTYCTVEGHAEDTVPIILSGQPPFLVEVELKHSGSSQPEVITVANIEKHTHDLRIPQHLRQQGHAHLSIRKVRDSRNCQSKSDLAQATSRVQISVHDPPTITALEAKTDYCVGERLSFRLSGSPPFTIFYTWKGRERKATSAGAIFNRVADEPGTFAITAVADSASDCRARVDSISKTIHALPRASIARGKDLETDIHEGGEVEIAFELAGDPPFEFTYTRAELGRRGPDSVGAVLETKTEHADDKTFRVMASEEGVYEVISVRDRWCVASRQQPGKGKSGTGQKLLVQP